MLIRITILLLALLFINGFTLAADPASADAQAAAVVGRHLQDMFTVGYARSSTAVTEAQRHYELARADAKGDLRVEYAFALVLLKQLRNKEALTHLQLATKSSGMETWQARQALIWLQFVSHNDAVGFRDLSTFAKLLADAPLTAPEREQYVTWIGQVVAALQKSAESVKQRDVVAREDEALKSILGTGLHPSFDKGKADVHALYLLLDNDVQQTREMTQTRQKVERDEKQAQVADRLEGAAEKRESLKKTAEEAKKHLDDQVAGYDKQLARLEHDYDFLQQRVVSLSALQLQVAAELTRVDQQAISHKKRHNTTSLLHEQRKAILGAQQLKYQVESDQTMAAMLGVSQRAQVVVNQKAATIGHYEQATGKLAQKDAALDKWQERLKKDGERLKAPPKSNPPPVANKMHQLHSFRTYVDLDLTLNRDRLLHTYSLAMPASELPKQE